MDVRTAPAPRSGGQWIPIARPPLNFCPGSPEPDRCRQHQLGSDHARRRLRVLEFSRTSLRYLGVVKEYEMKLARTHLEMLIWPLLAFLCVVVMGSRRSAPLSDDSYQYLNVADNLNRGRGVVT